MSTDTSQRPVLTAVDYDPFATAALTRVVPSTEPQREIWLAASISPEASLAYNESVSLRFNGMLNSDALRAAVQELVDRHDALRASFGPEGDTFCVNEQLTLELPLRDLSADDAAARTSALANCLREAVETPFVLEQAPLFRAELLRLASDDHVLVLTAHHLVCDGWSWWVLVHELSSLYAARTGESVRPLPTPESFADYALAQASQGDQRAFATDEAYWLSRYADSIPVLDLPTDRSRPAQRTFASKREDHVFDTALLDAIKGMGARRGVSLFATLLGSFATLMTRLSGQHEAVIGIPTAAQASTGDGQLVGHCVSLLPLRCAADPAAPFAQLLKDTQATLLEALEHQHYTFGSLLKRLGVRREPSRLPLVSVLFNIDQALDHEAAAFQGAHLTFASNPRHYENFELSVNAVQEHGQLRLECQYNSDLFDAATVRRWLQAYETLLRAAVAQTDAALGELPLVDEAGRRELAGWQPAPTPFDVDRRAHEFFEAQCDRAPERTAVRAGDSTLTYAQLDERANRIARLLRSRGVRSGALVGIALERGIDMLAALLGVLKTGAGYVPLDPAFPEERLAFMVSDASLAALVTEQAHAARFDLRGRPVLALDQLVAELAAQPATRLATDTDAVAPDAVAYVIYTSGSTGRPKGVQVPHRATANFLTTTQREPGMRADDRLVAVTTLSFDIAFMELMLPLAVGAEVIVASREQVRDGVLLRKLVETSGATYLQATPAGWRLLLDAGWQGHPGFRAVSGGEPLSLALAEALLARCGEVWNGYGPTEATVYATFWRVENPRAGIVIGRPVANTTVWVLDPQRQLCPAGVPGELWIGGAGVALGYLNRPELSAERFVRDPYADASHARLYRTGDRGRWLANGTLEHQGRLDFQVKLRGFRIEPGEIEANLAAKPEVAHAVVIVREDRPGDARLVAYLVARAGMTVDETGLRVHLRQVLPEYMVPQHFIVLDAMPLLPNGKIGRARLPAPADALPQQDAAAVHTAPRDELERQVSDAMAVVLGAAGLGVDDNFFDRGGHSLLAAQLTARLNRELSLNLPLAALFEAPTVAQLAERIRGVQATDTQRPLPKIARLPDRQRAPLSILQQRMLYLEQMRGERTAYNTPSAHRLRGPMNEQLFERALQDVVRRQAVLRTSIETEGDEPQQRIHDTVDVTLLPVEDLSAIPAETREAELKRRLEQLIDEPFDLSRAPLFRTRLFRLGAEEHVFFFVTHHIIWDGWSFDLLYQEMSDTYAALLNGETAPRPELDVQYGDFAAWHRAWLRDDELNRRLVFWKQHLQGEIEPLELPTDHPRPLRMSGNGATEWLQLPNATADAIHALGKQAEATPFMVLLAIYFVFLHRQTGQHDIIVGTPVRGREVPELEPVMGYFVNALPLRMKVDPTLSFVNFLRQLRASVVAAFSYPEVPFDQLVQELHLPRDASRPPLYQAMFSFQDVRGRNRTWGQLRHERLPVFQHGAADDIGVWFVEHGLGMSGGLTYNTDIFDASTAARLRERYLALLSAALQDPQQPVAQLALLPAAELELLNRWNATEVAGIADGCVHALVEAQTRRTPDRVALRCDEQTLSYAQLDAYANRIAHALRAQGIGRGALVGIALDRGFGLVAAVLGALKAGAGYVPLDPAFPRDRLTLMVEDADIGVLITEHRFADRFVIGQRAVLWLDESASLDALPASPLAPDTQSATPTSVAYVIYTSGSTGRPKGVAIPHRAVRNFLASMCERPGLREDDRLVSVTTLSFDIAVLELFGPLGIGAEVVLARREEVMDGESLMGLLASSKATVMQATPATWRVLLKAGWQGSPGFRALCGGEALALDLAVELCARCAEVWNMYGPTETTVWSTCWQVEHPERGLSIGTPIANTTVWILDAQGQRCPIGVPGEIWIGGDGVALGYLHRPELTAERFVDDPFASTPGARMYRTGDRGRWLANGTLEHLGRLDFQIKLRGFRIEPSEIEMVARVEPAVSDCVAVTWDVTPQDRRLVLYAVSMESEDTLFPRLRAQLSAQLPGYMQPQHLVLLPALPQTPNGKVDRKALPPPVVKIAPATDARSRGPVPPPIDDPRQRYLAGIWCELIGVQDVRPADNFFDAGGHSLLAIDMAARVRRETGVRLNLLSIATGTLATLASELPESIADKPARPTTLGGRLRRLFEPR
ncbi:hypothetical protein GCM10007862_11670 [Dyella lipolytica]|uniref:Amino acid adenylation domain-containing protein n=1 Tax=Dyella lipolytica TaxID=1867835 RepID=A0ABW8IX72_9GAMM|nr:non-ribosomal peptide synthetase [Dyella lipolytica]GLQ46116.1 hypothetical protein GCM10007862_11670 [Dyella lipolytica]